MVECCKVYNKMTIVGMATRRWMALSEYSDVYTIPNNNGVLIVSGFKIVMV